MQLAPADVELSFEVTFDSPTLDVGMSVYDDSGALPVLLLSPFPMVRVAPGLNTYRGKFTPENGKSYIPAGVSQHVVRLKENTGTDYDPDDHCNSSE